MGCGEKVQADTVIHASQALTWGWLRSPNPRNPFHLDVIEGGEKQCIRYFVVPKHCFIHFVVTKACVIVYT